MYTPRDDTHIYGFCNPTDVDILQMRVSFCIDDLGVDAR